MFVAIVTLPIQFHNAAKSMNPRNLTDNLKEVHKEAYGTIFKNKKLSKEISKDL